MISVEYIRTSGRKKKYKEQIKVYTDGSKKDEKVAFVVITPEWKSKKRMWPQNTGYSAEQEAIIKAMSIEENDDKNTPKTRTLRKLLDEESVNVAPIWVPGYKWIAGNEQVDVEA
jgi:hypothetical protein